MTPSMYDVTNIDMWKYKMSIYLKTLGMHVYLATTKKSYLGNDKYIEVNAPALVALRYTLSKDYLFIISHCDFAFTVWDTLASLKLQMRNYVEKEYSGDEADQVYFMAKGMTSLR